MRTEKPDSRVIRWIHVGELASQPRRVVGMVDGPMDAGSDRTPLGSRLGHSPELARSSISTSLIAGIAWSAILSRPSA